MPTRFDTAIPDLIDVCEAWTDFSQVDRACIVRDLRGRVRLVVDGPDSLPTSALESAIRSRLGQWFSGPVLNTHSAAPSERRVANAMFERATSWPAGWPTQRRDATGGTVAIAALWSGYQRVLSKQAWLDGRASEGAWPLVGGNPAIVAFYSFKGGVGRSTLLGVVAWQLAKASKKVVCLDLDLEAPGLAGLFGVDAEELVIDHLLAHAATGRAPGDDPVTQATIQGAQIGVVLAGRMNRGYIEKLARLDYLGTSSADQSPVARALSVLLEQVKGRHHPDYILLDCRAGLHDLGGLSLTDVAHVDVLVGRDTPQGREGLALTLEVLGTRRAPVAQRIVVAQTMVPLPMEGEVARATRSRFRSALYESCRSTLYAALEDEPAEEDDGVAHYPWPIGLYDEIAASEHLGALSTSVLDNAVFQQLRRRIEALAAPEGDALPAEEPR